MITNPNRRIYDLNYSNDNLKISPESLKYAYDRYVISHRFKLLEKYTYGHEVLDLCCGTGAYAIPILDKVQRLYGVDFSDTMLKGFVENLGGSIPPKLYLIKGDAASIPLRDSCVDVVYSYTSLYNVPDIRSVYLDVSRVLRHSGRAILEVGNRWSLSRFVNNHNHKHSQWARDFSPSLGFHVSCLREAGFTIVNHICRQILPMYGAPLGLFYLYPLLMPQWKYLMGIMIKGRLLDEIISGFPVLRPLAFRHIFIVTKT
jgi:ubiquinone/menaquinone biosynthesis C-methylase UbiE